MTTLLDNLGADVLGRDDEFGARDPRGWVKQADGSFLAAIPDMDGYEARARRLRTQRGTVRWAVKIEPTSDSSIPRPTGRGYGRSVTRAFDDAQRQLGVHTMISGADPVVVRPTEKGRDALGGLKDEAKSRARDVSDVAFAMTDPANWQKEDKTTWFYGAQYNRWRIRKEGARRFALYPTKEGTRISGGVIRLPPKDPTEGSRQDKTYTTLEDACRAAAKLYVEREIDALGGATLGDDGDGDKGEKVLQEDAAFGRAPGLDDTQPIPALSVRPPWVVVRDGRDGVRVVARARTEAAARDAAMAALLRDRDGRVEYHVHHVHHAPWTDSLGAHEIPGDAAIDSDLPVVLIDRDGVPGEILQPEDPKHAKALDRAIRGGYDGQALLYLHGSGGDRRVNLWRTGKGLSAVAQVVGGSFGDAFPGTDDALHDQIAEFVSAWSGEMQAVAAGKVSAADAAKAVPDAEDALSALGDAVRALQGAAGQLGTVAPGTAEGQRHRHRRLVQSLRSLATAFFRGAKDSDGKAVRWEDVLPEVPTTPGGGTEVLGHENRPMGRLCDPASILGVPPAPPRPAGSHTAVSAGEAGTILLSTASVLTATMASELSEGIADAANEVREWAFTWETRRRGVPQLPSEGIMQQLRSHDLVPGGGVLGEGVETDVGEDGCFDGAGGWACEDGTGASTRGGAGASSEPSAADLPRVPSEAGAVYLLRDRRAFLLSGPGDPDHEPNIAVFTSRGAYAGPRKIGDRFYDVWTVRLPGGEPYDVGQIAPGAPAAVQAVEIGAVNRLAILRDRLHFRRVQVSWDGTKGYELRGLRSGHRVVVVPRTGRGFIIEAYSPTGAAVLLGAHLHEAEARRQALVYAREHGWFRSAFGSSEDDGLETDIGEDVPQGGPSSDEVGAPPAEPAHSAWAPDRTQSGWPYGDNTFPASGGSPSGTPTAAPTEAYVPMPPPSKYAPPPPVAPGQSPHTPWVPIGKKASDGWPGLPNKPREKAVGSPAAHERPRPPRGSYAPGGDAARAPGWGSGTHSNTGFGRRRKP